MTRGENIMKKSQSTTIRFLAVCLSLILLFSAGCGGGGGSGSPRRTPGGSDPGGGAPPADYGLIMGTVSNGDGQPLDGVIIAADGKTTSSNEQGYFSLAGVRESQRMVVNFTKDGYSDNTQVTKIKIGRSAYIETTLSPTEKTTAFHSANGVSHGETYTPSGGSVAIGPNALVDASGNAYVGTASIAVSAFDPTGQKGMACFPGEFTGIAASGESCFLESFGFMDVTISDDSGNPLQIAAGRTAEIVVPVPYCLASVAPNTIPLWYFDNSDGEWHEDGFANLKSSGTAYAGTVTHFTTWNCDQNWPESAMAWVQGIVVNAATGEPIDGANVVITGNNWSSGDTGVDVGGTFTIPVMPDRPATLVASDGGVSSDPLHISTTGSGDITDVGTIYIGGVPKVTITLLWKENPSDLDAHLTIPTAYGHEHLYWQTPGMEVEGAKLNTDDVSSFGPEVITIYELKDGVYRYGVHHYSGSGTIPSSPAVVNVVVQGLNIYRFDPPPAGADGPGDAWLVFDLTVAGGKVVDVTPVGNYRNNVSTSDSDTFSP